MMGVHFITVGKRKEKFCIAACEEYIKRLGAYCKWTESQIPEEKLGQNPSQGEIDKALEKEAKKIVDKIPDNSLVVVLCVEGKQMSSPDLAQLIKGAKDGETRHLVFIVGGSFGLAESVKDRATVKLSMSLMTFPHHIAQVMLLEQVYRGFKILEGSSYHK